MTESRRIPVVSVVGVIALVLTLVLNTVVGVLLITTRQSTAAYSRCTAEWQQQFGEAYRARVAASSAVDNAMDGVVRAVAAEDSEAFKLAVQKYVGLRDEQAETRKKNPLPPLPEVLCGDPKEVRR